MLAEVTDDEQSPDASAVPKLLGAAVVVGVLAGVAVIAYLTVEHWLQGLLWDDVPEALGGTPAWWVFGVLLVGAVGVWLALKLPGHGGHRPLDGLGIDIGPKQIGSVVLAALISLSIGAVVGPEAPLMAIGSAVGGFVALRTTEPVRKVLMLAGAAAGITMILGNPMVSAVLVLEAAALKGSPGGKKVMLAVLPVLIAMGFGYLIQVGVGDWGGVGESQLAVPGLPAYDTVQPIDLGMAIVVAVVTAVLAVTAVEVGTSYQNRMPNPLVGLLVAGFIVAAAAVITRAVTGQDVNVILFSGQESTAHVLGLTSVGVLVVIAVAKTIAYSASLGGAFRGGMLFPAVFLGVVVATASSLIVSGANVSALAAAGIAAAVAAVLRLPFTAVLLALLLCAAAGLAVTTPAIIGAVVGVLFRVVADARLHREPPEELADESPQVAAS
ncbi:MAG TPA: chloride channel protein [Actinomycetota bacterium]|nr:chloride channel protein [Actinomycetota bacterium]HNL51603.1 chloride channel protein [Actinomycetota bacterium]HNO16100.1 chloride channel protein [Actinomycetota bacterium]HUM86875.1 chloride channel protein [Actinomycetota bacterium]